MEKKKNKDIVKISKKNIYAVIGVLILIGIIVFCVFYYYPKVQKENGIEIYKKALFDSAVCQYNCPLEQQVFQNRSQLLPTKECVTACLNDLSAKNLSSKMFTDADLQNDDFMKDVEKTVIGCRSQALNVTDIDRNAKFFGCIANDLKVFKEKYSYLN
ncbi:MAG: hypothetical protein AABY10_04815 [Nanoarchaeota archaeon]